MPSRPSAPPCRWPWPLHGRTSIRGRASFVVSDGFVEAFLEGFGKEGAHESRAKDVACYDEIEGGFPYGLGESHLGSDGHPDQVTDLSEHRSGPPRASITTLLAGSTAPVVNCCDQLPGEVDPTDEHEGRANHAPEEQAAGHLQEIFPVQGNLLRVEADK
ncbi:MAG: hypothetical protein COV59_01475 [Candidatus Magasanikbacteria bacterium CG11_big_fil_rev_8_21_14_0_20_39_34]|uniref:Uncharacterized protein n=1 Tax=Candidatus Magasanikbacteria bacterium CG11_big_fil_rev_8_21_14_0_20_39_34 TaxID=1974653 RepID=A0A2H0N5Y4_9BACT|nr:MAG: hypothetical protein COV59_01475 [Candidatus Magasanikbacteria bacterium CG11_big_fil_rev_8_21_14_0_20_39_34]